MPHQFSIPSASGSSSAPDSFAPGTPLPSIDPGRHMTLTMNQSAASQIGLAMHHQTDTYSGRTRRCITVISVM